MSFNSDYPCRSLPSWDYASELSYELDFPPEDVGSNQQFREEDPDFSGWDETYCFHGIPTYNPTFKICCKTSIASDSGHHEVQQQTGKDAENASEAKEISNKGHRPKIVSIVTQTKPKEAHEKDTAKSNKLELCWFGITGICIFGSGCMNMHGIQCTNCELYCLDPNNAEKNQEHFMKCSETNEGDKFLSYADTESCSVCLESISETNSAYAIMQCPHCVCYDCAKKWRNNKLMEHSKCCPVCREPTPFIFPSKIWPKTKKIKEILTSYYIKSLRNFICTKYNGGLKIRMEDSGKEPGPFDLLSGLYREHYCDPLFMKKGENQSDKSKGLIENVLQLDRILSQSEQKKDERESLNGDSQDISPFQSVLTGQASLGKYAWNPQFECEKRFLFRESRDTKIPSITREPIGSDVEWNSKF